ncbi:MAG TPA: hypothetical protein VKE30_05200 [Chthoniobacterales bacterium]|nr:hypothetical protein [Chthoniobacterales bacterium]
MKSDHAIRIALIALSISTFDSGAGLPIERSVSPSGQFVIYGGDAEWRGAVSALAERTKANLLALLRRRDQWTTAVVINLQPRVPNLPEIPATSLRFGQTGSGLKLQLDFTISREMKPALMEHEILRVILLEMIYRNQTGIPSGANYVEPPEWLIEGLLALTPDRPRESLIDALASSEQIPPLGGFLRQRLELVDPIDRSFYTAYSLALVQVLTERENGDVRLGCYIDRLALASSDPLVELEVAFPELAGNDLEKIWKSKIASLKSPQRIDLLTFSQTDEKLDELLQTKFRSADGNEKTLSLEDLCQKRSNPTQRVGLKKLADELILLAACANPALRSIVQDYQQLVAQLALGKNHAVETKLGTFKTLRARLSARMSETDDYLNWFEATQLQTESGLFDNPVSTSASASRPRRKDAFSAYLDAMEAQF